MRSGIAKNSFHFKDYSFERTFGTLTLGLPENYNADKGTKFPDQNKDGYPNGCSGYTQNALGETEYGIEADPAFVYKNTLDIAGLPPHSPVKVRDSFKATRIYGLKESTGKDPLNFRRGDYFDVDKAGDYFDGARNALWMNRAHNRTLSVGTPWFAEWFFPKEGILKAPKKYVWDSKTIGHNYQVTGWKTIKGEPHLIIKPWCGPKWGDNGYGYVSRETFNKVMGISGTFMYIQVNFSPDPEQIKGVKLDIQEFILTLARRLISALQKQPTTPPEAPKQPVEAPKPPETSRREALYEFAVSKLGKKLGRNPNVPKELNCANALSDLLIQFGVKGLPMLGIEGTATLTDWIAKSPEFQEINMPEPGDLAAFPTGTGNGKIANGHIFIAGKHHWMSNNSNKERIWDDHWTQKEALDYYWWVGGMKPRYFRCVQRP